MISDYQPYRPAAKHSGRQRLKVLVADPEEGARAQLVRALSEDCQVTCAEDAPRVLRLLRRFRFDLVIYDADLPHLGGLFLLRHLKLQSPETAVLLITERADPNLAGLAIRHGALDCLTKPVKRQLLDSFLSLVERAGGAAAAWTEPDKRGNN